MSNIAPGIPNIPTIKAVIKFIPICNPQIAPIMLITYNKITPNIEFKINFRITFIGTIKIFPIIIIPIMQAIYISNILNSIFNHIPPQGTNSVENYFSTFHLQDAGSTKNYVLLPHCMLFNGQILLAFRTFK